jgi:hypothetical protein
MGAYLDGLLQLYSKEMADGGMHSRLDADDLLQMMQGCCSVVSTLPQVKHNLTRQQYTPLRHIARIHTSEGRPPLRPRRSVPDSFARSVRWGASLQVEQIRGAVQCLLEPVVRPLEAMMPMGGPPSAAGAASVSLRMAQFDRIACVFRYIACEAVVAEVFVQLWPLLQVSVYWLEVASKG